MSGATDRVVHEDAEAIIAFAALDPAGETLYFVRYTRESLTSIGIWRLDLVDGGLDQLAGTSPDAILASQPSAVRDQFAPIPQEPRYEGLVMTPSGDRLLACGTRERVPALLVIDVVTGESRELLDVPDIYCPAGVSDDAAYYQSVTDDGPPNRWRTIELDLGDGTTRELGESLDWNISVVQDVDGSQLLLYVSSTEDPYRVDALDLETGERRVVLESASSAPILWPHHDPRGGGIIGVELPDGWFLLAPLFEDRPAHPPQAVRIADGAVVQLPLPSG